MKTGIVRQLWLHLLAEGGYSTKAELAAEIQVEGKRVDGLLDQLASRGFCQKYRNPDRKNGVGYGVTLSCKVPNEVTVKDILAAVGKGQQLESQGSAC